MPAPSSDVLTACRTGTAARHMFFFLDHPLGEVRAWDGVGNFEFDGETYLGVGGLGLISGLSDSTDLQQHEVTCTLNTVPLSALTADDGDIRGADASVYAVLLTEDGTVLASREIFTGYGDVLKTTVNGDKAQLTVTLHGLLADWSASPRSYYTPSDQQRAFAGDSGFDYVPNLQDSTVSGWNKDPEVASPNVNARFTYRSGTPSRMVLFDGVTGELYGNELYGLSLFPDPSTGEARRPAASATYYVEDGTGAIAAFATVAGEYVLQVGGVNCVVNVSHELRTAGGALIQGNNSASEDMRRPGTIASDGSATANHVAFPNVADPSVLPAATNRLGWSSASSGGAAYATADWTGAVFNAADGAFVRADAAASYKAYSETYTPATGSVKYYYKEDVTGTDVIVSSSGSGKLQVGGSDCKVSTTGVILSPSNRRIIRSGGDPAIDYLRIWT